MDVRVLYVNQEVDPYVENSPMGVIGRAMAESLHCQGCDVRNFMPKFGIINERKNQLHEVIRLSGVNIIINDTDHPLIIKVASMQPSRMQVYFIDNDDYFQKRDILRDKHGVFYPNNDERLIFYSRGVLETVKNLVWQPEIIHCNGWYGSLMPYYLRGTTYNDDPLFSETKIVVNLYNDSFHESLDPAISRKLKADGGTSKGIKYFKEPTFINLMMGAISAADGVVVCDKNVHPELIEFAKNKKKRIVGYCSDEERIPKVHDLYNAILSKNKD